MLFIHLPWVLSAGSKEVTAPSHAHHDCCLFPRLHLPLGSGTIKGLWQQHPVTYEETHQFPCYAALNSNAFHTALTLGLYSTSHNSERGSRLGSVPSDRLIYITVYSHLPSLCKLSKERGSIFFRTLTCRTQKVSATYNLFIDLEVVYMNKSSDLRQHTQSTSSCCFLYSLCPGSIKMETIIFQEQLWEFMRLCIWKF